MMNNNPQNSTPKLKESDVHHIAKLSRLALTQEEIATACSDLHAIFDHIDLLKSVDTSAVEPLDHPTELSDRWREDVAGHVLSQGQVLSIAPATKGSFIVVPQVLGGGEA